MTTQLAEQLKLKQAQNACDALAKVAAMWRYDNNRLRTAIHKATNLEELKREIGAPPVESSGRRP